jgi:hypothetical protein
MRAGADMWMVHRNGQGWAVTDALAVAFEQPIADTSQDVVLRSMEYKHGKLFASCSAYQMHFHNTGDKVKSSGSTVGADVQARM